MLQCCKNLCPLGNRGPTHTHRYTPQVQYLLVAQAAIPSINHLRPLCEKLCCSYNLSIGDKELALGPPASALRPHCESTCERCQVQIFNKNKNNMNSDKKNTNENNNSNNNKAARASAATQSVSFIFAKPGKPCILRAFRQQHDVSVFSFSNVLRSCFLVAFLRKCRKYHAFRAFFKFNFSVIFEVFVWKAAKNARFLHG